MPVTRYRNTQSGATSFGGFASFEKTIDLSTPEGLLELARQEGGAVAEVAEELIHPERSILSTIGNGFKKTFSGFVEIIETPAEIVAGILSPDVTIAEAIREDVRISDVLLGEPDPDNSGMKKVGSFIVRTALDILTDPLTYVTFGASSSIFGIRAASKIKVGKEASKILNLKQGTLVQLGKKGQNLFNKGMETQINGTRKTILKDTPELAGKELDAAINATFNRKLEEGFVKDAISKMIEKNPALIETIIDKGGIKFMGKALLSGQRIRAVTPLIPGITHIDNATKGVRTKISALFSTKVDAQFGKLPEEWTDMLTRAKSLLDQKRIASVNEFKNVVKANKLTIQESEILMSALEGNKIPKDPRLARAFLSLKRIDKRQFKQLRAAGVTIHEMANHMPHILVDNKIKSIPFSTPIKTSTKYATSPRAVAKWIDIETGKEFVGTAERFGFKQFITAKEKAAVTESFRKFSARKGKDIKQVQNEILSLGHAAQKIFDTKSEKVFEKILKDIPVDDRPNMLAILRMAKEKFPPLEVGKLVGQRAKEAFKEGVKVEKIVAELSEDAVGELKKRLAKGDPKLAGQVRALNQILKDFKPKKIKKRKIGAGEVDKEVQALLDAIKAKSAIKKGKIIEKEIDESALMDVLTGLSKEFNKNPVGVRRLLDSIIGRKQQVEDLLNDIEFERIGTKTDIEALPLAHEFFKDVEGKLFKKVSASIDEIEKAGFTGFDKNAITALVARSLEVNKTVVMRDFIREAAEKFGAFADEAPEGYIKADIKLPDGILSDFSTFAKGIKGEEILFHPAVAKQIENFAGGIINDEATKDFLKAYDKIQNFWKASVTSMFAAFHGRNGLSNVFLHYLDIGVNSLNPANHAVAANLLLTDSRLAKLAVKAEKGGRVAEEAMAEIAEINAREIFTDANNYKWTFGELKRTISENGVAFNPNLIGSVDITRHPELVDELFPAITASGKVKHVVKRVLPISQEFIGFKVGRRVGNIVEEQARLVDFIVNLKKTGDVNLAAKRTKQFLFDYQNLTAFEKTFLRRIIPFYTFTRKNIELQAKTLLTAPGRIAAEITALTTLGDVIAGQKLSDEDMDALPDWVKTGIILLKSKKGNTVEILGSLGTPIEQPFQQFQPNILLGSISPLIRVPIEQMTGYSFFHGKAMSDVTNAAAFKNAPKIIKNFIGYTEVSWTTEAGKKTTWNVALRPQRMNFLLNLPPTSRVLTSLRQMQAVDVSTQSKILQALIGIRPFAFDLEIEASRREKELRTQLEDTLSKARVTAKFTRTFIPKN